MFTCTVVSRQAFSAAGMRTRTDSAKAPQDCPALWYEKFGPRMQELILSDWPEGLESYGISWLVDSPAENKDECAFDYFAAMPWPVEKPLPQGFERTNVPAGLYIECQVPSLNEIGLAYQHIFTEWLPAHPGYAVSMMAPSYELYPKNFSKELTIYFPILTA